MAPPWPATQTSPAPLIHTSFKRSLNPNDIFAQVVPLHRTSDPVTFLGFVLRRKGDGVQVRLRHDNVVRMRQRMALVQGLYRAGALEIEAVRSHLMAWLAHAAHGQTKALVEAELRRLSFVRGEE